MLEITVSLLENNHPCFCNENYRSCRQALGASAHCASDIMAPHSGSLFGVDNFHSEFTLAFSSASCASENPLQNTRIHTNKTRQNAVVQERSGILFRFEKKLFENKHLLS